MDKGTNSQAKIYDPIRAQVVKWVAKKFNCSEYYVRKVDNNPSLTGGSCEEIRKAYRTKYAEMQQLMA